MTQDGPPSEYTSSLIDYLKSRADDIGRHLAVRYREEIVEYRALPPGFIERDVAPTARRNLLEILDTLGHEEMSDEHLQYFRDSAVRRFQQGVPIQALLQAYRVWGRVVWEEVRKAPNVESEAAVAMVLADRIMRHGDVVATAVEQAYLRRAAGVLPNRAIATHEIIETLVRGAHPEVIRSIAATLHVPAEDHYWVVLARHPSRGDSTRRPGLAAAGERLETALRGGGLHPVASTVRDEELIVVCHDDRSDSRRPLGLRIRLASIVDTADDVAMRLGVGSLQPGLGGVAKSYTDARRALVLALQAECEGDTYALWVDALLDETINSSPHASTLREWCLRDLISYDAEHRSGLVATVRQYVATAGSLARTAEILVVQPNTVKYRLQRIREITGFDPLHPRDFVLFAVALKLRPDPADSANGSPNA